MTPTSSTAGPSCPPRSSSPPCSASCPRWSAERRRPPRSGCSGPARSPLQRSAAGCSGRPDQWREARRRPTFDATSRVLGGSAPMIRRILVLLAALLLLAGCGGGSGPCGRFADPTPSRAGEPGRGVELGCAGRGDARRVHPSLAACSDIDMPRNSGDSSAYRAASTRAVSPARRRPTESTSFYGAGGSIQRSRVRRSVSVERRSGRHRTRTSVVLGTARLPSRSTAGGV